MHASSHTFIRACMPLNDFKCVIGKKCVKVTQSTKNEVLGTFPQVPLQTWISVATLNPTLHLKCYSWSLSCRSPLPFCEIKRSELLKKSIFPMFLAEEMPKKSQKELKVRQFTKPSLSTWICTGRNQARHLTGLNVKQLVKEVNFPTILAMFSVKVRRKKHERF